MYDQKYDIKNKQGQGTDNSTIYFDIPKKIKFANKFKTIYLIYIPNSIYT